MNKSLGRIVVAMTDRPVLILLNALTFMLLYVVASGMGPMVLHYSESEAKELEVISTGMATILIGYGALLQSRQSLLKVFRVVARHGEIVGHLCEAYGGGLLIFGLVMIFGVVCIVIPDRLINTSGIEWILYGICLISGYLSMVLIVRFCYQLVRLPFHEFEVEQAEAGPEKLEVLESELEQLKAVVAELQSIKVGR